MIDGGGGTDIAELRGLSGDYTITAVAGGYRVTDNVAGRDGSDLLSGVETLRFSDGSTVGLPASAPPAPQGLPALAGDKAAPGREVLPAASDDVAKDGGPQTLPGETDTSPAPARDRLSAADFGPRDGDFAATLSLFGDLPVDDGYLFVAGTDEGSPEVLPVMHDDFVLTAKFAEGPPVMPTPAGDFDGVLPVTEMEFARDLLLSLAREKPLNPNAPGDGLTLFDDWSGVASPTRHDVWA